MSDTTLAPVVSVHQLPYITSSGVAQLAELRFQVVDDFAEGGLRQWSLLINADNAKRVAADLMLVGYAIEPEDDRP